MREIQRSDGSVTLLDDNGCDVVVEPIAHTFSPVPGNAHSAFAALRCRHGACAASQPTTSKSAVLAVIAYTGTFSFAAKCIGDGRA